MKIRVKFVDMPPDFDEENNCYIRAVRKHYDVEFSSNPDFIFYGVFGAEFLQYPNAVKIFLMFEPAYPNFNDCDYAVGSLNMKLEGRYFKHPPMMGFGERELQALMKERKKPGSCPADRKFCNFIYANAAGGRGAQLRIDFCKKLSEYRHVDCPGRVLNNMPALSIGPRYKGTTEIIPNWAVEKIKFASDYKFSIAFENTALPGWTTEKLIHPLLARSVPIYWGNADVGEYFNEKAFIRCTDAEEEFARTIERVKELDRDEDAYHDMLCQPPLSENYPVHWEDDLAEFFSQVIDRGPDPFEKNPIGFSSVTAQDFVGRCRNGKVGMSAILKTSAQGILGWLNYKLKNKR